MLKDSFRADGNSSMIAHLNRAQPSYRVDLMRAERCDPHNPSFSGTTVLKGRFNEGGKM